MFKRFLSDRRGNFSMMTAFLVVPLLGAAGMALDITQALEARTQLISAADSAALAALAEKSAGVLAAAAMKTDGRLTLSEKEATAFFNANSRGTSALEITASDVQVSKSGKDLVASVTFTAEVPTVIMALLGKKSVSIEGRSKAAYQQSTQMDFFMLLDNTPSMGVGATQADINKLVANTRDQCAFACHIVSEAGVPDQNSYYFLAKRLGVTTRINVVAKATEALIREAQETQRFSGQFRFATYSFGKTAQDKKMQIVQTLTDNLTTAATASATVDLMSIPNQGYNNDQQTPFDDVLKDVQKEMKGQDAFSKANDREPVLFFVTDGVADHAKSTACKKRQNGSRCMEPIDIDFCQKIKDQGGMIAVLYTTYLPLPTNSFYRDWIKPFQGEIGPRLAQCATPGYFFEVSPTQGIEEAMKALFKKVIRSPRLVG
ncbi:TadE/TadG family type IV pilus assembly protein [Rhizobium sp. YIM 134829]|uniref:TadE/TadG family type IV pilus assembly protein n=1 Tax=Rhizobium sp. YIM 134829 TaxID=3390453 RepID=UPI00397C5C7F